MPRRLISDAHEWINEIPTVPIYYLAKPQPRERAWRDQRGKKTLNSMGSEARTLVRDGATLPNCGDALLRLCEQARSEAIRNRVGAAQRPEGSGRTRLKYGPAAAFAVGNQVELDSSLTL